MMEGGGVNVVLAQQHARFLLSTFRRTLSGKVVGARMEFLREYLDSDFNNAPVSSLQTLMSREAQVTLLDQARDKTVHAPMLPSSLYGRGYWCKC